MPEAKDRTCGLYMNGVLCGRPAHYIEGSWNPLHDFGQLWFFCDEHWEIKSKLRDIYGEHYSHAYEKI